MRGVKVSPEGVVCVDVLLAEVDGKFVVLVPGDEVALK